MANPKSKTPKQSTVEDTEDRASYIKKHRGALKKITPLFDKLNFKQQGSVAILKNLQKYYPDDEKYSDNTIRNRILSELGVASGEYDDLNVVQKDSAGREKTLKQQKKENPAGFAHGGRVHRGRRAASSSEKG